MARRPDLNSDFAQKLLGDIRARKERLGYASSGQKSSNGSPSFNAGANSRRSLRGAQETAKNNFHSQSSNNKGLPSPRRKTKQPILNASSQEIVPYRKSRTPSMDNADVSMALALALSNTGKLQNIEVLSRTKVGAEFVTHHGSINFSSANTRFLSNGRTSNRNQFLFLPDFGVKKLNEMISAYSNGRRNRSSLAVELEESLNMLIMLQDASDYMGASSKSQVLLLKDKEENENDLRSKTSKQNKLNSEKKSSNSNRRSVYSGSSVTKKENGLSASTSNSSTRNSNYSNHNRGNSEHSKLRIPNVIARLMGLEDVPDNVKPKVVIKEVEPEEKNEKDDDKIRDSKNGNDMSAKCDTEVREETRLERITRTYIDSKRGMFGKCGLDAQIIPPKKNDEKGIVRNQKKKEKPNHRVVKQKTAIAPILPKKADQKVQRMEKDLLKKRSLDNSHPGKGVNVNLINKKKETDGNIWKAKNNKVLEKGCKTGEANVQKIKILTEVVKKMGREPEVKIADLKEDDMRTNDGKNSKMGLDQTSSKEKDYCEISGINIDQHKDPEISISVQEQLQLPQDEQTDKFNCSRGCTHLYYEDPLTENQILLRDILLSDFDFIELSQALFAVDVTAAKLENIAKTPLEKGNNTVLLNTAHEILKRKATRLEICDKIKIQSINSLIRELDSDLRSLEYGKSAENFDLQRIIEREIVGGNPDATCSWEFGWSPKFFAPFEKCEVAKELEKHLTSGLITELTRDLVEEIILV